jgi:hypothetical protein
MKNQKIILTAAVVIVLAAGGFYLINNSSRKAGDNSAAGNKTENKTEDDRSSDAEFIAQSDVICDIFPKEKISSSTGLDIVFADVYSADGSENSNCRYYINNGKTDYPVLSIGAYKDDPVEAKAKYGNETSFKGWQAARDDRITMDNFITYNKAQQLNDIFLITGSNGYYRITLYSPDALKDSQMIDLAAQVSSKINRR